MLQRLKITNFKCFNEHTVEFRDFSLMVGNNNCGKSSIIDALKIVSIVCDHFNHLNFNFSYPNKSYTIPSSPRGISFNPSNMGINFKTLFHRYENPPASIVVTLTSGETIHIFIFEKGKIFFRIFLEDGTPVTTYSRAEQTKLPSISVLPQLTILSQYEEIMSPMEIHASEYSTLFSTTFRNQINFYFEYFERFKSIVKDTWFDVRIRSLEGGGSWPKQSQINLFVQDADFVAEVAWMGHGLQLWLQLCWFITLNQNVDILILDEPDVYLHPDLQHKLIRLISEESHQTIIATHSPEIISDADPDEILIIDHLEEKSNFTTSLHGVQEVINNIGGVSNIQLNRLWRARKCLFVEGKDAKILNIIYKKMYPNAEFPFELIPKFSIGGWSGWNYVVGSSLLLKNSAGDEIAIYCIFDSDYHTKDEIESRKLDAQKRGITIKIWNRKEIENYFIIPKAIYQLISNKIAKRTKGPTTDEIEEKINSICDELKELTFDSISNEYFLQNKSKGLSNANKSARKIVDNAWSNPNRKWNIVSGKKLISNLSYWSQHEFGVSFNTLQIANEAFKSEIPEEMRTVIEDIYFGSSF